MNNKAVAWILTDNFEKAMKAPFLCRVEPTNRLEGIMTPLYTQEQLEEARKLGMQQERALWNLSESTQEIMNTHPHSEESVKVKELTLTDEEIMNIVADKYEKGHGRYSDTELFFVEFARAILRKAQEK